MGALRLIAVPLRRLLHDRELAQTLVNDPKKSINAIWGIVNEHALGTVILSCIYLFCIAVALIFFLMALSYVIYPLKVAKDWQKRKSSTTELGRRQFFWWFLGVAGAVLLFSADATWSNIASYSGISGTGKQALGAIDSLDQHLIMINEKMVEAGRFITGVEGLMVKAAVGGHDIRPLLKLANELVIEAQSFFRLIKSENKNLPVWLQEKVDALYTSFKSISIKLREIQGIVFGDNNEKGIKSGPNIIDLDFQEARESIQKTYPLVLTVEFYRFLAVFIVLVCLILTVAAGIQFYRMKKFRLVALCMTIICLVLVGVEACAMVHLILGTAFGAFCDAIKGVGDQQPIKIGKVGNTPITISHVYNFGNYCTQGQDALGSILSTFQKEGQVVAMSDNLSIDGQRNEITIKVKSSLITIPIINGRADLKKGLEGVISDLIKINKSTIISYAQEAAEYLAEGASYLKQAQHIPMVTREFKDLMVMISGIKVGDTDMDSSFWSEEFKNQALQRLGAIISRLESLHGQAENAREAADYLSGYLAQAINNPDEFVQSLQQELNVNSGPFVANVLQPMSECKKPGSTLVETIDSICLAGSSHQSIWLAMGALIILNVTVIIFLVICRKFSEERGVSITGNMATQQQQYPTPMTSGTYQAY